MMNRKDRRLSQKEGKRVQKLDWNKFQDVSFKIPSIIANGNYGSYRPDKVYQNNKYIVQVFFKVNRFEKVYTKVMIRRSDEGPIYNWNDLFRIKNEIFGEEIEAINFFPKVSELVDQANLYWMWIEESR